MRTLAQNPVQERMRETTTLELGCDCCGSSFGARSKDLLRDGRRLPLSFKQEKLS